MNPWLGFEEERPLRGWGGSLAFSLGLHLLIFLVAVFHATFFSPRYNFRPVYSVRLVNAPLTVKSPGQPKHTKMEKTGIGAAKVARNEPWSKKELRQYEEKIKSLALKQKTMEKKAVQREERLKDMLEGLTKDIARRNSLELKKTLAGIQQKITLEGGAVETRTPLTNGTEPVEASLLDAYLGEIWDKIRANWVLPPQLLKNKDLETVVVIRIRKSGDVERTWVEKKSGNAYFDYSAMRAVHLSSPFSPLPEGIKQSILELGIRFRPGDRG